MRYVILGAGAIGGTLGGRLADAGRDVTLLARGAHAAAMKADGLHVYMPDRTLHVHPHVVDDPAELTLHRDDVLILAVKSQQTQALLDAISGLPVDGSDGVAADVLPIVSAQNGVANEPTLLRYFARVYGSCVMCPTQHLEPGVVLAPGAPFTGAFDTGRYSSGTDDVTAALAADLTASGFLCTPRDDVMAWKYAKLIRNLANSLDALLGNDLDDAATAISTQLASTARDEARRCFQRAGIGWVSDDEWAAYRFERIAAKPVEGQTYGGSSTWQSITRGTGNVEVDYLNGEIVLLGRRLGIETPVNLMLQREVTALAARGGRPGDVSAGDLQRRAA